jgi:DNA-binding response OmpR family regulator
MVSSTITVSIPHPNTQWFDPGDQASLDEFADPDIATFLFRQRGRFQVRLPAGQEFIIGRSHTGDAPQPDIDLTPYKAAAYGASRLHAKLRHEDNGWWLEDLHSSNGTWINGMRLAAYQPVHLEIRNQVLFGNLQLYILLPHKVFSGVLVPINTVDTLPTHVVNVEGDKTLQNLLDATFRAAEPGINLHHFATSDKALAYITASAQDIDLFILDIGLSGSKNGLEIAEAIRYLGCPGSIILTSADAFPSPELLASLQAEFLPKPSHILEIAPKLFDYRLNRSSTPGALVEPPLSLEDCTMLRRPVQQSPRKEARKLEIEAGTESESAHAANMREALVEEQSPLSSTWDQDQSATLPVIDESKRPKRFGAPRGYLQRVIDAIRRL